MNVRVCVLALVAACGRGDATAKPPERAANRLVGTWRAVDFTRGSDSAPEHPFGQPPRGYIVYDATGHVFFQVSRRGDPPPPSNKTWDSADAPTLLGMLNASSAYFGTYAVDEARGIVTHRIEGEIPPKRANTEVATPFAIRQDTLALSRWLFVRVR